MLLDAMLGNPLEQTVLQFDIQGQGPTPPSGAIELKWSQLGPFVLIGVTRFLWRRHLTIYLYNECEYRTGEWHGNECKINTLGHLQNNYL